MNKCCRARHQQQLELPFLYDTPRGVWFPGPLTIQGLQKTSLSLPFLKLRVELSTALQMRPDQGGVEYDHTLLFSTLSTSLNAV